MKKLSDKAIKDMIGLGGVEYARQEAWDIQNAASVLSQLGYMCINEADEPADIKELSAIMRALMTFIEGELSEMEKASRRGDGYEKSAPAQVREEPKEELNLSYAKSMGYDFSHEQPVDLKYLAVKYVAKDEIKGYTFLWGGPKLTDVEIEYFTRDTNFWDDRMGKSARPLTWDHAQDPSFKASPVIGEITDFGDDELGRWYVAKLDTAHQYRKAIDALIKKGVLGTSSDSAPQYVVRQKTGKSTWLKEWPWFASALTNTPAEPRMIGSLEFLKSLGVELPDVSVTSSRYEVLKRQSELLKLKEKVG
jgi:hypothetical protein